MNKRILLFNAIYYAITLWFIFLGRQDASSSLGYGFFILIFWIAAGTTLLYLLIRRKLEANSILDKIGVITATPIPTIIFVVILLNSQKSSDKESYVTILSQKKPSAIKDCLPNELFASFQLADLISLNDFNFDSKGNYFYGEKKLTELDSQQKEKWIRPFVEAFPAIEYRAQLVAKLSPINNLQPITLRVVGTDYLTLWLLLLNENCDPVSVFYLEGKNCEGPMENDSTVIFCPVRKNRINGSTLITYETRMAESKVSGHLVFDSLTFSTSIDSRGQFITKRLDSIRFYRKPTR